MESVVMRVTAGRVKELVAAGAQLVEVLPRPEFEEQHLAGAVNIPLKELDAEAVAGLDRGTPVVVYCWDSI
jgi:rhodanese-related sulfurtransferase